MEFNWKAHPDSRKVKDEEYKCISARKYFITSALLLFSETPSKCTLHLLYVKVPFSPYFPFFTAEKSILVFNFHYCIIQFLNF
jgi:hypothetical protein